MDWWNFLSRKKSPEVKLFTQRRTQMEINIEKVGEDLKAQAAKLNAVDLVIVMDCTASMMPWIDQAKSSILDIINSVQNDHTKASVRVGFVAYRDFCDGDARIQAHPLSEDGEKVKRFIQGLTAFGGGDEPEDIPGGLDAAMAMGFSRGAAKRLVLVADAPCHGSQYSNMPSDQTYAAQIAQSPCIRRQMRSLKSRGIDFTFIEVVPHKTATMVAILQDEYERAHARDGLEREFYKVALSQSGDIARFGQEVASSASSSLAMSKARSVFVSSKKIVSHKRSIGGVSSLNHYGPTGGTTALPGIDEDAMDEEEDEEDKEDEVKIHVLPVPVRTTLDWAELDAVPAIPAIRHSYHFRQGAAVNWAKIDLKHSTQETTIKLLPACFAKGAMRSAHAMYDMNMGKQFVAKFYYGKAASSSRAAELPLENDVQTQIVAKQLATEFSCLPQLQDGVDFIFTSLYEIQEPEAAGLSPAMAKFTAEPFIEGTYKKYNNNNGWINDRGVASLRDTAQAFSHYTWQKTYGQLMVVDLQGVGCIFTDPQIHSVDKRAFGRGNRSEAGMAAFFCTHECNDVCLALGLLPFDASEKIMPRIKRKRGGPPVDKQMTCSCPLCGAILEVLHSTFIKAHASGRDIYCEDCNAKVAIRVTRDCTLCEEKLELAPYWYLMKGMQEPTTCKKCKAMAHRMVMVDAPNEAQEGDEDMQDVQGDGASRGDSDDGFSIIDKP